MVRCYSADESINKFSIGYMINHSLNCNKVFREQVENFLSFSFHEITMETIKYFMRKKNTCVMALIMFYENNREKLKKVYRVLSCVIYSFIDNCVCVDCLSCESKTLSSISSKPAFEQTSFNILLGIGISELLLNQVYYRGFVKIPNSTVILNYRYCLVNNYLEKWFYIL